MQPPDEPYLGEPLARSLWNGPATDHFSPDVVRAAFLDFHQREYVPVIVFLMKCGAIRQDAEDATQEAFVEAWRLTKQAGEWEKINEPHGWIRTVALRRYQRPHGPRRRVTSFPVAQITDNMVPGHNIDHGELTVQTEFVCSILRELEPDTRAVMAFHIDGFKSVEIASYLNMTVQKVRDLKKKGRKTLRAGLVALREQDRRRMQ